MTILKHNPYLIKVTTKGEGKSKIPKKLTKWFMNYPFSCSKILEKQALHDNSFVEKNHTVYSKDARKKIL